MSILPLIAITCYYYSLLLIAVDCCCMQSKDVKGLDTSPDRHLSATTLRPSVTLTSDLVLTEVRLLHPTACWKPASGVANLGSGWFTFCRMSAKVNPTTLHVPLFASWSDSHLPGPLRSPHQLLCEGSDLGATPFAVWPPKGSGGFQCWSTMISKWIPGWKATPVELTSTNTSWAPQEVTSNGMCTESPSFTNPSRPAVMYLYTAPVKTGRTSASWLVSIKQTVFFHVESFMIGEAFLSHLSYLRPGPFLETVADTLSPRQVSGKLQTCCWGIRWIYAWHS